MKAIAAVISSLAITLSSPALCSEEEGPSWDAATVYAVLDSNEWCWGGSVHVDLWSGEYVLLPRPMRVDCQPESQTHRNIEHGSVEELQLASLRSAYRHLAQAGMEREDHELILTNGGREVLAVVGPNWSAVTPRDEGRWSDETRGLRRLLFNIFGNQRAGVPASDLTGRREIKD